MDNNLWTEIIDRIEQITDIPERAKAYTPSVKSAKFALCLLGQANFKKKIRIVIDYDPECDNFFIKEIKV